MNFLMLLLWIASVGFVLWFARRSPITGLRRIAATACRIGVVSVIFLALLGLSHRGVSERPQHVVYLVDDSDSMDAHQKDWIARRISSLDSVRPKKVLRAVIKFGTDTKVVIPFGSDPLTDASVAKAALEDVDVNSDKTNFEAALLEVLRVLPSGQGGHVVLLSDGRETTGDANRLLAHVRRLGLSVFPVTVPVFGNVATVWDILAVPPVVKRGAPIGFELVLFNGATELKEAVVTVSLAGVPIERQRSFIRPGWQVIKGSIPALQQGTMALDIRLSIPAEGLEERRTVYTEVEGPPHILFVDDDPTSLPLLASALKKRDIELSLARPADLPKHSLSLLDYDAVLLFGVPKSTLEAQQVEALREFVEKFGGGLVMVGLGGDLAEEISSESGLDELLPVAFEPKGLQEARRRVCMVMLIDRSASMLGPRIAATKRAAVELVNQLAPEDLVGVLAFDTKPYIVVEVQAAERVGLHLIEKLVKLRSSGGTDVYPALVAAKRRLDQTDAKVKHIILLSDGNTPNHKKLYTALIEEFNRDGVTVSTIGIGSAFVNTKYLKGLSGLTGGTFYQLRSLDELPRLIAHDTQDALGKLPFSEGYFRPKRNESSEHFTEIMEWPPLKGFLTTTIKPGAEVDMTVTVDDTDEVLLAQWSLGEGRVVVFTSDADVRWSPNWVRWPNFSAWWAEVLRYSMRTRHSEELFVWVDEHSATPQLVLEGELQDPQGSLLAPGSLKATPVAFVQTGVFRWEAPLEQVASGWYQLIVESEEEGSRVFAKRWVQVGIPQTQDEEQGQLPSEAFLQQLARSTGGAVNVPDAAFLPPTTKAISHQSLLPWILPWIIGLVLVDVALRGPTML